MTRPPPQQKKVNPVVLVFISAATLLCFYISMVINKLIIQPR